jgi:MoaA/NifB/PqqE/SkfB family radical SAM enzyme
MFGMDRLKVIWRTLSYREAWTLGPRQSAGMLKYLLETRPVWRGAVAELNAYSAPVGGESYRRYLRGLKQISRGQWAPLVAHVSVTDRCGYQCARCSNTTRGPVDPSVDKLSRLMYQLRSAGTARVALTGGEPLLRPDLAQIVADCGRDLSPLLFTSGQGLDAGRARELCLAGLSAAYISLDHFSADDHDRIRGVPGAFPTACQAIRVCVEAGLYTAAQAVVEPPLLEAGALERFLEFCHELGVHEVMLLEPVPVGAALPDGGLSDSARAQLAALHRRSARDHRQTKVTSMSWLESAEMLGCQAGFSFLYVSAQGEVFPCDFALVSFGNAFELGIAEIHARMVRCLKSPSRTCLARCLRKSGATSAMGSISWPPTQAMLQDYRPGPLPGLMHYLCHARRQTN